MTSRLHQINVAYAAKEDRLLLRVTTSTGGEYRIWLTRRFTSLLLNVLHQQMEQHGGAPTLAASGETRRLFREGALEKSFESGRSTEFPLGETGILAFRINVTRAVDGNVSLNILPESGQGVILNLNKTLLYLFYNVITQGIAQADWRLAPGDDYSRNLH
jgi:hypothetical protein